MAPPPFTGEGDRVAVEGATTGRTPNSLDPSSPQGSQPEYRPGPRHPARVVPQSASPGYPVRPASYPDAGHVRPDQDARESAHRPQWRDSGTADKSPEYRGQVDAGDESAIPRDDRVSDRSRAKPRARSFFDGLPAPVLSSGLVRAYAPSTGFAGPPPPYAPLWRRIKHRLLPRLRGRGTIEDGGGGDHSHNA